MKRKEGPKIGIRPIKLRDQENQDLIDAHYAAIGKIAAAWSFFEALVDVHLIDMAGLTEELGYCFTTQMLGSRPRINAFIAVVKVRKCAPHWESILNKFALRVTGLQETRNRILHDVWELSEPSIPKRLEASAFKQLQIRDVPVSTGSLLETIKAIEDLQSELHGMVSEILAEERAAARRPTQT